MQEQYFICQEKPEKTFWERFTTTGCFGEDFLTFRNRLTAESDSFFGVENRTFPYKTWCKIQN
jgi:hypothetical protein